jgi:hypothetical protein
MKVIDQLSKNQFIEAGDGRPQGLPLQNFFIDLCIDLNTIIKSFLIYFLGVLMGKIDDIDKLLEQEIVKETDSSKDESPELDESELLDEKEQKEKKATLKRELFTNSEIVLISKRQPKFQFSFGNVILVICGIIIVGFLIAIIINENLSEQISAFFSRDLGKMKNAEKEAVLTRMREIETLTTNRYGTVTLFYYPKNAKVHLTQIKSEETVEQYVDRIKRGIDNRKPVEKKEIPNTSLQLREKQIIEQLPFENLPILEKSEDTTRVYTYDYDVLIEREGYEPRKFFFFSKESTRLVQGAEALVWEQRGPGIFLIEFKGADLLPKPETARENFVKAKHDMLCLEKRIKNEKLDIPASDIDGYYSEIRARFGFKTSDDWKRIEEELKKDAEWWKDMEKQIAKDPCTKD